MKDYKKYLLRQLGLKESQFVPSPLREKDEYPGIDPDELEKGTEEEEGEHGMTLGKARKTAAQHLEEPGQAHYYSGLEKAKKAGMLKDQAMLSPTAIQTPVIGLAIRGSSTGGLPSGVDQGRQDISPSKVGGYDRVQPQDLNHHTFNKTPVNPEIKQSSPVNPDPTTGQGVTHPHQIQVTANEEPQSVTGASTDSDDTLQLKSALPKGIDIDIAETGNEEKAEEEEIKTNDTTMIPSTSLSETFARHKKLMEASLGLKKCPCGCEKGKCDCPPDCKCKKTGVCECATCGCGDPTDTHGHGNPVDEANIDKGVQDAISAAMNKSGGNKEKARQLLVGASKAVAAKGSNFTSQLYAKAAAALGGEEAGPSELNEGKHKAGCQCGFCKNKGSFGKKKKEEKDEKDEGCKEEEEEGKEEQEEVKKQQKLDESYAAPFQRMRSLAGVGNMILTSNGLFENKNDPGASKPFNTNWKMDKEKAGFVKIDEEKLNKVKATLERKSKRGTLSDKELQLAKKLDEVLKGRVLKEGKAGKCSSCGLPSKDLTDGKCSRCYNRDAEEYQQTHRGGKKLAFGLSDHPEGGRSDDPASYSESKK